MRDGSTPSTGGIARFRRQRPISYFLRFLLTSDAIPHELPSVWGMIAIKKVKGVWGGLETPVQCGQVIRRRRPGPGVTNGAILPLCGATTGRIGTTSADIEATMRS